MALPDRLVFTFLNVATRRNGPQTSFVAELFYMTSTLPAGSARITVLDSGLPEAVIGAFVGNENLQDADEVELLVRVCVVECVAPSTDGCVKPDSRTCLAHTHMCHAR